VEIYLLTKQPKLMLTDCRGHRPLLQLLLPYICDDLQRSAAQLKAFLNFRSICELRCFKVRCCTNAHVIHGKIPQPDFLTKIARFRRNISTCCRLNIEGVVLSNYRNASCNPIVIIVKCHNLRQDRHHFLY
jgi:hypothetical protein